MYNVIQIANYFVQKAKDSGQDVTHLKLQKLLYFAQGWNLAVNREPLFEGTIQAWKHGPVIPSLYDRLKVFGGQSIPILEVNPNPMSEETKKLLDAVWDGYGKYNALTLSSMTHQENTPWAKIVAGKGFNAPIPNDAITFYFDGVRENSKKKRSAVTT